jgi:hypothetical protein
MNRSQPPDSKTEPITVSLSTGAQPASGPGRPVVVTSARPQPVAGGPNVVTAGRPVDDQVRRAIAENLMTGATPQLLLDNMTANGFAPHDAVREINAAIASPYYKASEILFNRMRKREWILSIYRKVSRLEPSTSTIPRRHKLSRAEFLAEYYSTNRPVIITGMMDDWPAMTRWNLDFFDENFGDREVEVQMGRDASPNYEIESGNFARRILFREFVELVRTSGKTNDFYLTANNDSFNRKALNELWNDIVYVPEYLRHEPSAGFFWMGPAGTITPFHHDLTNNFMAQVIGKKRLKIVPSWDMPLMRNHRHCFSLVDGRQLPALPRPPFEQPQVLECTIDRGEILFLPIGCMHFVEGLEISVTMSFTNFVFDNDFYSYYGTYGAV